MINPSHALATGLRGFPSSTLRVRVTRRDERAGLVWVTTADLLDSGTPLVLDAGQVAIGADTIPAGVCHRDGLVIL